MAEQSELVTKYRLKISQDDSPEKPRWDPISRFATWHRRYTIGDEQPKCEPDEWLASLLSDDRRQQLEDFKDEYPSLVGADYNSQKYREYYRDRDRAFHDRLMELVEQEYHILPVYAYEHSGITIRTGPFSCPWDSGQIGWIVLSMEKVKTEGITGDPLELLRSEIELCDLYLTGQVWGFQILKCETCNLGCSHEEVVESCWGFYGEDLADIRSQMSDHFSDEEYGFDDHEWDVAWEARFAEQR